MQEENTYFRSQLGISDVSERTVLLDGVNQTDLGAMSSGSEGRVVARGRPQMVSPPRGGAPVETKFSGRSRSGSKSGTPNDNSKSPNDKKMHKSKSSEGSSGKKVQRIR